MKGYKLFPDNYAKYHFGTSNGVLCDNFSSDQLFGAIINNLSLLYPKEKVEKQIELFREETYLTSLFYGLDVVHNKSGEKLVTLYFLPRPKAPIKPGVNGVDLLTLKAVKKIAWLSLGAFQKLINTWDHERCSFNFDLSQLLVIGSKFACLREEMAMLDVYPDDLASLNFINISSRPRISKPERFRDEPEGDFFYEDEMEIRYSTIEPYSFQPFMFFLLKGEITSELEGAIKLIPDTGLGGKRSLGMGLFKSIQEFQWELPFSQEEADDYFVSLSCVYPDKSEVSHLVGYELGERNGYIYSGIGKAYRKRTITVVKEGSVFSADIRGQLVDITPSAFNEHKIFLNGKSFNIPLGRGKI